MKFITHNQLKYALTLILLSVTFRFGLNALLASGNYAQIWMPATAYGVAIFIAAWVFGKKDKLTLNLFDIGFRFHLTTYIVCNLIAELWVIMDLNALTSSARGIHLTALIWGAVLLLHFALYLFTRKDTYKGLKKSELFD